MASKYNPYNSVKKISELKGMYNTAKATGGDYKQYQREAEDYYYDLMQNGYGDVADELSVNDYDGSLEILKRFKPNGEFNVDNAFSELYEEPAKTETRSYYDDFIGSMNSNPTPQKSSTTADDVLGRLYGDDWMSGYNDIMNNAADLASGRVTPGTSDAVQSILDSFKDTDNLLNGKITTDAKGNVTGGLNIDHYNTGKNQLDYINNFDYTAQPYYESIMGTYQLQGDDAAKGALASGASGNSGNIDSYAAANANRQQLAFTNAGHQAALAAAQQNQSNWMDLYNAMGGHLTDMGTINAQNLATGANMYGTESAERQNALNQSAAMANSEAARRMEAYLAKLNDDAARYGIDADILMNRETNAANLANAEAQRQIDQYLAELADSTTRYGMDADVGMNAANNQAALEQILAQISGEKELAGINNTAALQHLGRQLAAEKYIASMNNQAEMDRLEKQYEYALTGDTGTTAADTKMDADTAGMALMEMIVSGEATDITDFDMFEQVLYAELGDSKEAQRVREYMERLYPDLFDAASAPAFQQAAGQIDVMAGRMGR